MYSIYYKTINREDELYKKFTPQLKGRGESSHIPSLVLSSTSSALNLRINYNTGQQITYTSMKNDDAPDTIITIK